MKSDDSNARAAYRTRISDIETQILDLERSIRTLRSEQDVIRYRLASYRYPVLTLPNELVSEIFIHCLPPYPICPPGIGPLSPTRLTHICRKWRQIALATPGLWRAISLNRADSSVASEAQILRLRSWVSRSGCYPLSILMNEDLYENKAHVAEILQILLPHRERWEYLKLSLPSEHLPLIEVPMPQLCELEVRLPDGVVAPVSLDGVPRLEAVTLWDFPSSPDNLLPWSQLTSLDLVGVEPHDCTPILAQTVNLLYCGLVLLGEDTNEPDIRLPFLESLVLMHYVGNAPVPTQYLNTLILPALRTLQVPEKFLRDDVFETFSSFVSKSGCELEEVCITGERSRNKYGWGMKFPGIQFSFKGDLTDWWLDE
ncbi:hypothetical protein DFH06DRAFT_454071 [Mycena polygramma]|nr:hypothetical protein DFH06DRAFT_454071 [Mycena polygramma]